MTKMHRTQAQFAADTRRSRKAKAKSYQHQAAEQYQLSRIYRESDLQSVMADCAAISARIARCKLNALLTGNYADFV